MFGSLLRERVFSPSLFRYTWGEIVPIFLTGTLLFGAILLMTQAIRLSEFVVSQQVGIKDIGRITGYLLCTFLPYATPVAFLFAVVMAVSRASSEGEILGLQAAGISVFQMFFPVVLLSGLIFGITTYLSFYHVPQANRAFELLLVRLYGEKFMAALKPGVFTPGFHGLVLYAEQVIPVKNEMKKVFIYDERDEAHPLAITARAGVLRASPEGGMLTLRLTDGAIHEDTKTLTPALVRIEFDVYDINLNVAQSGTRWRDYTLPSYTLPHLKRRLEESRSDVTAYRQLQVELHRRLSLCFGTIVFAGLGFFIGLLSQRGMRGSAVVLCMMVGVVYWLCFLAANALAVRGGGAPWVAAWTPNVIFVGISGFCYRLFRRR